MALSRGGPDWFSRSAAGRQRRDALAAVAVALLALGVFWPARDHAWLVYDDDVYITARPEIAEGLTRDGWVWAFTTLQGANWFPLTRLSWMLDWQLGDGSPRTFHTTNLLLHAATSGVLLLALTRLTGRVGRSAFVAAVFAVHPLHVESVAWAAARKDVLSGLCFALALLAWAGAGAGPRSRRRVAAVTLLLGAGLLAKQTLVTFPFVLLLLDDWPLARTRRAGDLTRWEPGAWRALVREKLPLFALVIAMSAVAWVAQRSAGAMADLDALPLLARIENAWVAVASYVRMAFWPSDLAVFYPHPEDGLGAAQVAAAVAVVSGLTAGALAAARRHPAVTVGWLWFGVTLVPVLGLVQIGSQAMADRYTYLPLIGLSLCVAWGVPAALVHAVPAARLREALLGAAAVGVVTLLAVACSAQLRHWRDSESLFRHALEVTTESHVAHIYLGAALLEQGRTRETIEHWQRATRLEPGSLRVANNLAWLLATAPDPAHRDAASALEHAERAARLAPGDAAVLDTLAAAQAASGRYAEAERTARRALEQSDPASPLHAGIRRRIEFYAAGRPWRER